ncbi:uncharacterized protein LOC144615201 [Panthera onca]
MWILLKRLSRIQRATQGLAALLHGQKDPQAFPDTTRRPLRAEVRKGGEVDVKDVKAILKNMGIEFTDKERLKLLKNLPFNDDNKVFKNRLLDGVKSLKGGKVNMNNLGTVLNNLGIKLADTELKDLAENMHVGVDEKIPLETLMENITDFTGEKIESSELKNVLGNLGIELTDKELEKLLKILPIDGESYKCLWELPGKLDFYRSA